MTQARESNEPRPGEPAPGEEDPELDAAAIAALLGGGGAGEGELRTAARAAAPTPPARAPEPGPVARAAEPADESLDVEPDGEFVGVELTPVMASDEAPPAETAAPPASAHESVAEVVAAEPARGPSLVGRALGGLRERWADAPARLVATLREGAARVRGALARSAAEEASAPEAAAGGEPAPAREPEEALAREGSAAQPWVAKLALVSLCVNITAMAALLAVLFLGPHDAGRARAGGRSRDHAAASAPAGPERGASPGPTLKLGEFFVLLREDAGEPHGGGERYARISLELELPDERAEQAASARLPPLRDAALSYLSDCTAKAFRGSEALGRLKAMLSRRFSEAAPSVPVRAVYFTDLVVQ
jgi:flagellar basal body-associated protein FliL